MAKNPFLHYADTAFDAITSHRAWENGVSLRAWMLDVEHSVTRHPGKSVYNDFWQLGNALDACVHYIVAKYRAGLPDNTRGAIVKQALSRGYSIFQAVTSKPANFSYPKPKGAPRGVSYPQYSWNDYGWWGNAFYSAFENADVFEQISVPSGSPPSFFDGATHATTSNFLLVAQGAQDIMNTYSWEYFVRHPPKKPRYPEWPLSPFPGGCWQHPAQADSGPAQTGLVNALYLSLTGRLALAAQQTDLRATYPEAFENRVLPEGEGQTSIWAEEATNAYSWLLEWVDCGRLLEGSTPKAQGLMLEAIVPPSSGPSLGQVWSGSQGWMLSALTTLSQVDLDEPTTSCARTTKPAELARTIAKTVWQRLFTPITRNEPQRVLNETPYEANFCQDPQGMVVGKGAMMRGLARALPLLGNLDGKNATDFFRGAILGTANQAWAQRSDGSGILVEGIIGPSWNPNWADFENEFQAWWGYDRSMELPNGNPCASSTGPAPWPLGMNIAPTRYRIGGESGGLGQAGQIVIQTTALDAFAAAIQYGESDED